MCRFVAYLGSPVLADDLLYKPRYSLISAQSVNAGEMSAQVNGDGFGIGWYAPGLDPEPCVFRSIKPAWSDQNLRNLARKIHAPSIFAHIRAASPGMPVEEYNSHPFTCGRLMFMHNGVIGGFKEIRRSLLRSLNDTSYDAISGSTDSEHLFGLILNHIDDPYADITSEQLMNAMESALQDLSKILLESSIKQHSYINACLTDGDSLIAVRYTTNHSVQPASMYYMYGTEYHCREESCMMEPSTGKPHAIVVASEPFTSKRSEWMKVERNSMLTVDENMRIHFRNIDLPIEHLISES
ncbi:MAG: class II glutamine amidotransferase [Ignavibacteria bacterium]|nr:class II glutamine amidotransferase [Ignavibacteria bacterium]MBM4173391.1 class II glutamine amidotransferase [Ignavibacteria bacterium]